MNRILWGNNNQRGIHDHEAECADDHGKIKNVLMWENLIKLVMTNQADCHVSCIDSDRISHVFNITLTEFENSYKKWRSVVFIKVEYQSIEIIRSVVHIHATSIS